jgi:3-deoxy-D-manno-octulosonic-acid transferase
MTINLPYSRLGFDGPLMYVRAGDNRRAGGYWQAVEDGLNFATETASSRGLRSDAGHAGRAACRHHQPGRRLKTYRALTSLARPVFAPALAPARAARQGRSRCGARAAGPTERCQARGPPRRFHAASVGETNAILPLMSALAEARPSLSFLTTGTVTSAKLAAQRLGPRAIHQYAPLDAPEYARLSRPLAAGSGRLHRNGDLAQPDPGKLGARHSSRSSTAA